MQSIKKRIFATVVALLLLIPLGAKSILLPGGLYPGVLIVGNSVWIAAAIQILCPVLFIFALKVAWQK
jgi:hypothetical protein